MGALRHQSNKAHKLDLLRNLPAIFIRSHLKISKSDRNVAKGAKAARLQRNEMLRKEKRSEVLKEKRTLSGLTSTPCSEDILSLLSQERNATTFPAVASLDYKLRATVLKAPHGDLVTCMEMAKVADLLAFVASPNSLHEGDNTDSFIDSFGSQCLSVFRTLGLPSTAVLIRDLPDDVKRRNELKKMCMLVSEFPKDCKFYPADTKDDLHKFMWLFKELRLTAPHWRNQRPYLMSQKVDMVADDTYSPEKCTIILSGYLRAHGLSVNQLVHISGAGDFQLSKIELLTDPCSLNLRKGVDSMEIHNDGQVVRCLIPDPMKQEPLIVENAPDLLAGEQTWPTEAEMAEADRNQKEKKMKRKRLPEGISDYQAAWILNDEDEDDGMIVDDGVKLCDSDEETEIETVMMDGDNITKEQIAEQIRKVKEHKEYPNEVDTPIDVPARKRFAKYRGLKSFRTSTWDPKESLPCEYARIFSFDNFSRTQKHVVAEALDGDGYAPVGSYARLYIKDVSCGVASKLCTLSRKMPVIASGLLQHESKISVLHCSIRKHDSYDAPIKSKEELVFHVGFRQFVSRPIYSSDSITGNKHKMERFLHAGGFSVASIFAPICFPSLPVIALKNHREDASPVVAAVGSLRNVDPDRIVVKKIVLTGYPRRVSKTKATVRYMFHNPEDPVEVYSKRGLRGRIREPVGTHGAMKCILNGIIRQHDTVCMSLYKRTYPKWPQHWFPLKSGLD